MKHNFKTIAPAVAVSTLFLLGCEEDVTKPDCTGDEALLGGSWQLLKEDDVTTQGQIYINDSGEEYTYALVYTFECGGDFKKWQVFSYSDNPQNPVNDLYEGTWEFDSADETISIGWSNGYEDSYEWAFEIDVVSETLLKGSLYTEEDTVLQEFSRL
ncbi:MAG: hypothetical protein CMB93_00660 [Flammeovirgaceae bacterium]|nr:hypothetical protein [Flammeovirgaceae bacterium]